MAEPNLVRFENEDGIGVITVDNPPVNALSPGLPEGIVESVERGNADPAIKAMVLIGAGRSFIAGADIRTFGTSRPPPVPGRRPHQILDASQKPVVAAIHGYALGGGLEIALAANYRIAVPSAKVGLPEVLIGILPGSGGTQRLPRLIGPKPAMEMIVVGPACPGRGSKAARHHRRARAGGRRSAPGGGRDGAPRRRCEALAADPRPRRQIGRGQGRSRPLRGDAQIDRPARAQPEGALQLHRRGRGGVHPAVRRRALSANAQLFDELENSAEARALRYAFFAEREVAKLPDIPRDTPLRPIENAAIIGAGTMGGGIAMSFAEFGFPVKILEASQEALDRGIARIRANYETSVKRGSLSEAEMERRLGLIEPVSSYDAIGRCDVVIEAVFERIPVKEEVFKTLDQVMKPGRCCSRTPRASTSTSWRTRQSARRTWPARISSPRPMS